MSVEPMYAWPESSRPKRKQFAPSLQKGVLQSISTAGAVGVVRTVGV
ncbi:hypothetical protein [Streptomyces sp. NPDC093089]